MGGDALVDLMKKPEAMLNNALAELNKKALASFLSKLKLFLATGTEPLLRKNMGERYFSAEHLGGGVVAWSLITGIALMFPDVRSLAAIIFSGMHWYGLANICQHWFLTAATGGALVFFFFKFGQESLGQMQKYRADGIAHHTQSRGTPRWEGELALVPLGIFIGLLLFDMPAAIFFVISCATTAKIASEQHAAIYGRYLDALDQKIEQEYLENAILGKCPTEITQLHKPLSSSMNDGLRNNIAAAAVGKSVKVVAKNPGSITPAQT